MSLDKQIHVLKKKLRHMYIENLNSCITMGLYKCIQKQYSKNMINDFKERRWVREVRRTDLSVAIIIKTELNIIIRETD